MTSTRGTTNGNDRGSVETRRRRRAWLMATWASDVPGFVRCFRCGGFLFNHDDHPEGTTSVWVRGCEEASRLTVDRIVPGCQGGRYVRTNIRPACGVCNSETGGRTRRKK